MFDLTINNKCKDDTITLGSLPASSAVTSYSGTTQSLSAITYSHSDNTAPCNTYHTLLVQVSADGGSTWHSSGSVYSDLLASGNTDFALALAPKTSTFDAGTTDYTRKVRLSVKSTYATQAAQTYTYDVTIKPKSSIVAQADTQIATTIVKNQPHLNVVYQVGNPIQTVSTTDVTVTAANLSPNVNERIMATTTKLYYSPDSGTTWVEVTSAAGATWTSQTGAESCISFLGSNRYFTLSCSDGTQYMFAGNSKTWSMKFTTSYVPISGVPSTP